MKDLETAGFSLDEFAALLSKYDYNFKPGDIVNGTVFALESKGAMIDIGAKTAAFMPLQEVSINRVEGLSDVLQPGEIREFFIMSEENEDGQLALSVRDASSTSAPGNASASCKRKTQRSIPRSSPPTVVVHWFGLKAFAASSPAHTSVHASPRKSWLLTSCR